MEKPIKGFSEYTISDKGVVKRKGKVVQPRSDDNGYERVDLWKDGDRSTKFVHRLVAAAFSGGAGEETDHNDKNRKKELMAYVWLAR